jgi:hypothetical protein
LGNELLIKINYEISQIDKLLNDCQPLIGICKIKTPYFIEISAAAMILHSFYNGIENIIIMIFKNNNEILPNSQKWQWPMMENLFFNIKANWDKIKENIIKNTKSECP